jgi:hypothetical protein
LIWLRIGASGGLDTECHTYREWPKYQLTGYKIHTKIHSKYLYYSMNFQIFSKWDPMCSMHISTLCYLCTHWLAGLNLNISMREYFRLIDFWATLYFVSCAASPGVMSYLLISCVMISYTKVLLREGP